MKKIYLIAITFIFSINAYSQCLGGRYATDTFTAYTTTSGVVYGSNLTAGGVTQTLTLDVYQPAGDVATNRPLIIWAHGGSFIGGTSTDGDVVALSQRFAKKGYVCASINYRLGLTPFDSVGAVKAVLRAVQDMKASIRFFYKDKKTTDLYKIDTTNIFIGGSSAGAITVLHTAYLDKPCEINTYVTPGDLTTLGGLDGNSGNPGHSTKIKGVINLCGALGVYGWLEAGDIPFCSMHGTIDATVKYNRGLVAPLGIPLMFLDGSRMLKQQANVLGISNPFYTWYGKDHVPYAGSALYMDTTVSFVRDYLISRMGCTDLPLLAQNAPFGNAVFYNSTICGVNNGVGLKEGNKNLITFDIFPNPSNSDISISFENQSTTYKIELFDLSGKLISSNLTNQNTFIVSKSV